MSEINNKEIDENKETQENKEPTTNEKYASLDDKQKDTLKNVDSNYVREHPDADKNERKENLKPYVDSMYEANKKNSDANDDTYKEERQKSDDLEK